MSEREVRKGGEKKKGDYLLSQLIGVVIIKNNYAVQRNRSNGNLVFLFSYV